MTKSPEISASTQPLRAAALMVAAMMLLGFIDNYIVVIAGHIGLWQFMVVRGIMALGLIALMSRAGLGTLRPLRLWAVSVRSLLISTGMFCYFGALAFVPLAQAMAGLFTSPIFVLLITVLVLGGRIGPWRVLAVAIGFAGILLVLNLDLGAIRWIAVLPVLGGLFYAMGSIATRALCEGESTMVLVFGVMASQLVVGGLILIALSLGGPMDVPAGEAGFLIRGWESDMRGVWPLLILQAVGSVAGVALIIKAYQIGEASQVSVLEYTALIFGPVFAYLLAGQVVTGWQMLGIAMIAAAGLIIAWRSR